METLSAGLFLEETESDQHTIQPVGTTTPAFGGIAEKGDIDKPILVTSFAEFRRKCGGYLASSQLAYAVADFFKHVKGRAYIFRVTARDGGGVTLAVASNVTMADRASGASISGAGLDTIKVSAMQRIIQSRIR